MFALGRGLAAHALVVDVDNAAGVDQEIRTVEYAAVPELISGALLGQLVVGSPRYDAGPQTVDRFASEHRAQGAGREHIGLDGENLVGGHHVDAVNIHRAPQVVLIDIGAVDDGAVCYQQARQVEAHVAETLYRHPQVFHAVGAETVLHRRAYAEVDAIGGRR